MELYIFFSALQVDYVSFNTTSKSRLMSEERVKASSPRVSWKDVETLQPCWNKPAEGNNKLTIKLDVYKVYQERHLVRFTCFSVSCTLAERWNQPEGYIIFSLTGGAHLHFSQVLNHLLSFCKCSYCQGWYCGNASLSSRLPCAWLNLPCFSTTSVYDSVIVFLISLTCY